MIDILNKYKLIFMCKQLKCMAYFLFIILIFCFVFFVNIAGAALTHARNQDYIKNNINMVVSPDGLPISFDDVSKFNIVPTVVDAKGCIVIPSDCSVIAIDAGSIKYKYYANPNGGSIVLYFDVSDSVIGYGLDFDSDGIGDLQDDDIDGDGVTNDLDAFDFDPSETVDSDGDGIGNNADAFPFDPTESKDTDGDGVGDNADAFPFDPLETIDSDGDGIGDNFESVPTDLRHKIRKSLSGDFSVNADGAAVYSIPFELPPGINGIEPELGFVYNSLSRRGAMRMGWSLSGLSEITRCQAKKIRDGFILGTKSDAGEKQRFCLDGQPLILVTMDGVSVYGQDGTEYVTEIRNDLKIKAIGQSGNGPEHFEVKTGDGKVLLYGSVALSNNFNGVPKQFTTGSKIGSFDKDEIYVWKLDSVTDRSGNKVSYEYLTVRDPDTAKIGGVLNASAETFSYLSKIRYDANTSGDQSEIVIDFFWSISHKFREWKTSINDGVIQQLFRKTSEKYGAKTDEGYVLSESYKLDKIRINVVGNSYKEYKIKYQLSDVTGKSPISNVKSIQECVNSTCSKAIEFDWEFQYQAKPATTQCIKRPDDLSGGEPAFSNVYKISIPYSDNFGWGGGNYYSQILGDYNNDDLTDVAVVYTFKEGNKSRITASISYSEGDGTFTAGGTPYSELIGESVLNHRLSGDFDNDGFTDLIATNSSANGWRVYTILNNGDGSFASPVEQIVSTVNFLDDKSYQNSTGDFNGDGNLDIIAFGIGHGQQKNEKDFSRVSGFVAYVALGNGDGTFKDAQGGQLATSSDIAKSLMRNRNLFTGDFNGDGITDIASSYFANGTNKFGGPFKGSEMIVSFGNEAGLFSSPIITSAPYTEYPPYWEPTQTKSVQTADVNGDGLTDIIAMTVTYGGILPKGLETASFSVVGVVKADPNFGTRTVVTMISNGDGTFKRTVFQDIMSWDIVNARYKAPCESTNHKPIIADFNNDGFADISFGSGDFYLGRGNGKFLKQGAGFVSGDDVNATGGGLNIGSFAIADTTYGSYAFDVNRDGNVDAVEIVVDKDGLKIGTNTYATNISQQFITSITDGFGRKILIDYEAISNNQSYTKGNSAVYPKRDIGAGRTVVKTATLSDGLGGDYILSYSYSGLISDSKRKEILGFSKISVLDSRENTLTTTKYSQDFPLTQRILDQEVRLSDDTIVKLITNNWSYKENKNKIGNYEYSWYTIKNNFNILTTYNDDGVFIGSVFTSNKNHDIFGQPEKISKFKSDGYTSILSLETENDLTWENYYTSRLKVLIETKTGSDFTDSITRKKEYTYYPNGLLASEIIEPNDVDLFKKTTTVYDSNGRISLVIVSGHVDAKYPVAPRTESKIIKMPALTRSTRSDATDKFQMEEITTNAEGHITKQFIDVRNGAITREIDENGLETIWEYDVAGDLIKETRPDNTVTHYSRDACNVHCPDNAVYSMYIKSSGEPFTETYYDIYDRPLRIRSKGFSDTPIYQDTVYDAFGQAISTTQPYYTDAELILSVSRSYDKLGRIISEFSPENGLSDYEYQGLNGLGYKVIKTQNRNDVNNTITLQTEQNKNLSDNPTQAKDADDQVLEYMYDAYENLRQTIDPDKNIIDVTYDKLGHVITLSDPDLGIRENGVDSLGQIRFIRDAKKQEINNFFDGLGRIISRVKDEGTDTWLYDEGPNAIGKLISEKSSTGSSKYIFYDTLSRIKQEAHVIATSSYTMKYSYDTFSRLTDVTYPTNFSVNYTYNIHTGNLETVSNGDIIYWQVNEMNAKGERKLETFGNNLTTKTGYSDVSGLIKAIETNNADSDVQSSLYLFNNIGNLQSRIDLNQFKFERFVYDKNNRLTNVYINETLEKEHSYNTIGNILSKSNYGTDYVYGQGNAGPHAVSEITDLNNNKISYAYDDNGNMISGDGRAISYTSFNKPLSLIKNGKTTRFEYGANQMRIKQIEGKNITTYINPRWDTGVHYEKIEVAGETKHKHYINAGNIPIAIYTTVEGSAVNKLAYLHKDHLGSITEITDETGKVIESLSYQAFGERRNSDWTDANTQLTSNETHHGFTGHEHLDDLGLIHMNARLYDPRLGRFLSPDTIIPSKESLGSFNRYTYVNNNPLSLTDPSGHMPEGFSGFIDRFLGISADNSQGSGNTTASNANFDQPVHNTTLAGISNSKDNQASSNRGSVKGWREIFDNGKQSFLNATGIPEPIVDFADVLTPAADVIQGIQAGDFSAIVIGALGVVTKKLKAGKNLIDMASKVTKEANDAAKRLGVNLDNIGINSGTAKAKIDLSSTLDPKDIAQLKDVMKARGATKAEIDTGFIANEKLDTFLRRRVNDGKSFNGGTVRFSNSKDSDFTIDFDL